MIPSREDGGGAGEARGVLEMGRLSAAASPPPLLLGPAPAPVLYSKTSVRMDTLGEVERLLSLEEEDC